MSGLGIVLLAGRGASAAPKPSPCRPGVGRGAAQAGTALRETRNNPIKYMEQLFWSKYQESHNTGFYFLDDITAPTGHWAFQPPAAGNLLLLQNLIEQPV